MNKITIYKKTIAYLNCEGNEIVGVTHYYIPKQYYTYTEAREALVKAVKVDIAKYWSGKLDKGLYVTINKYFYEMKESNHIQVIESQRIPAGYKRISEFVLPSVLYTDIEVKKAIAKIKAWA